MLINILIAGLAGVLVPVLLERLGRRIRRSPRRCS